MMMSKSVCLAAGAALILAAFALAAVAQEGSEDGMVAVKPDPTLLEGYLPEKVETATLALGCFWGPDARFGVLPGVIRTRVGYAGGTTPHPTYYDLDGHAETIQVDFDPSLITYEEILEIFWSHHDCTREPRIPQYRSVIFYHSEDQHFAAQASWEAEGIARNATPETEIVPFEAFTRAEDFHQKYWLLGTELVHELRDRFDSFAEFVDSTAAARLNGYVAGWGSLEQLEADLPAFALSEEGAQSLLDIFR